MIELNAQPYCHGCKEFEPELMTVSYVGEIAEQTVQCVHDSKCRELYKRIRATLGGGG